MIVQAFGRALATEPFMIEEDRDDLPATTIRMMVPTLVGTTRANERRGVGLMLLATASVSVAQVFFKVGADHSPRSLWIALGVLTYVSTLFLTLLAYRHGRVSILYPITALSYVVSAAVGSVFFSEDVVWIEWLAVGIIMAGILVLAFDEPRPLDEPRRFGGLAFGKKAELSGRPPLLGAGHGPRSLDVKDKP